MKNLFFLAAVLALVAISCPEQNEITGYAETEGGKVNLPRSTPEEQGVSSRAILNFLEKIQQSNTELHSFMLVKNGKVITERWWAPYRPDARHPLASVSKSFTSIAAGMVIDEGLMTVDTLLSDIFTEEFQQLGQRIDERTRGMTVRHILAMGTGMEREYWSQSPEETNIEAFLSGPVNDELGRQHRYSNIATYMVSAAITRVTGGTMVDFLKPRLFEPLGMDYEWGLDERTGVNWGSHGLSITTEDIAKFGQFLLDGGMWDGQRLVSEEYINEATRKQISISSGDTDWGYGYQFYLGPLEGIFRHGGAYGQALIVVPSMDIVISITARNNSVPVDGFLWEMLEEIKALPADGEGARELAALNNFSHLRIDETCDDFPKLSATYSSTTSRSFLIIFNFRRSGKGELITFPSYESNLFVNRQWTEADDSIPVITNGAWKGNVFTATVWNYESMFRTQLRFTFNDDLSELTYERRWDAHLPFELMGTAKRVK